jgi:hypothetical protein
MLIQLLESLLPRFFNSGLKNPIDALDLLINLIFQRVDMILKGSSMSFIFLPDKLDIFLFFSDLFIESVHYRSTLLDF